MELNYLVYMAADNNLERFGIKNLKALQEIGSSKHANIIVLFDRSPGYDKSEGNKSGTDLFYITRNPNKMNDDIIYEYGELDMTNAENLFTFLKMVNYYFPAKHTVLNVWSHGCGVYPDGIISRSVIEDYTTGYGVQNMMSVYDFAMALKKYESKTGKYIDVIQFDCCDMQMIEVAYELRNMCDYIVASETEIPGSGSNYKKIAEYISLNEKFDAENFSIFLVDSFYEYQNNPLLNYSYSALKTAALEHLIFDFNLSCEDLINSIKSEAHKIKIVRESLLPTDASYPEFIDLWNFITYISNTGIEVSSIKKIF